MAPKYPIPRPGSPVSGAGNIATREWYNYWQNLEQNSGGPSTAELENDITIISEKLGSPDGTPENIPPQQDSGNVIGLNSIASIGVLPGIVTLTLQGDSATPGNTYYYGTGPDGAKGFYTVSSAFLGTAGNIDLTTGSDGVTTINLAPVTQGSAGTLRAITLDGFGRVVQNKAATITGTTNRVTVTNGDASAGLPTIDISTSYAGQASITTLGTITSGVWNGTTIGPTFGGTGLTAYATGDLIYASGTNTLARRAIGSTGQVLTVVGGLPTWDAPASSGTVTSVDVSGGTTGLTTSGGPVTSSGTITLSGTLNITHGGTGQTTSSAAFDALAPTTTSQDLIVRGASSNGRLGVGTNGQVLTVTGGVVGWSTPASGGSVTSVGLATPSQFSVTGSPVTTSGTLTFAWNNQTANTVLSGPTTGAASSPTFRSLVAADIPALDFAKITTGIVPIAQGGTGSSTSATACVALGAVQKAGDTMTGNLTIATSSTNSTSLSLNNSAAGGRNWTLASSGGGPAPSGYLVIFDSTAGAARMTCDTSGNVTISSGSLTFGSTGTKVIGDFSNATPSLRNSFQSSTTNGFTAVQAIPNGTSNTAAFAAYANSNLASTAYAILSVDSTSVKLGSNTFGGATAIPFAMLVGGAQFMGISTAGVVTPGTDNTQSMGSASLRWSVIFAGTGTINTSDERDKTPVSPLIDNELAAAVDLAKEVGIYQWLTMVAEKGSDQARLHIGMTVQRAMQVMQSHGLDPLRYGFICHDSWDAEDEIIDETTGEVCRPAISAGDRYGFRPDELLLFLARGFDARLTALENRP